MLIKKHPNLISETSVVKVLYLMMGVEQSAQEKGLPVQKTFSKTCAQMGLVPLMIDSFVRGGDNYSESPAFLLKSCWLRPSCKHHLTDVGCP